MGNKMEPNHTGYVICLAGSCPPPTESGVWWVRELRSIIQNDKQYKIQRVGRDPPSYSEHPDFLFIAKDCCASRILVFNAYRKEELRDGILQRTWKSILAETRDITIYGILYSGPSLRDIVIFDEPNADLNESYYNSGKAYICHVAFKNAVSVKEAKDLLFLFALELAKERSAIVYFGNITQKETYSVKAAIYSAPLPFSTYWSYLMSISKPPLSNPISHLRCNIDTKRSSFKETQKIHPNGTGCIFVMDTTDSRIRCMESRCKKTLHV